MLFCPTAVLHIPTRLHVHHAAYDKGVLPASSKASTTRPVAKDAASPTVVRPVIARAAEAFIFTGAKCLLMGYKCGTFLISRSAK